MDTIQMKIWTFNTYLTWKTVKILFYFKHKWEKSIIGFFTCNNCQKRIYICPYNKKSSWSRFNKAYFLERQKFMKDILAASKTHLISCSNSINFSVSLFSSFSNLAFWDGAALKKTVNFICLLLALQKLYQKEKKTNRKTWCYGKLFYESETSNNSKIKFIALAKRLLVWL